MRLNEHRSCPWEPAEFVVSVQLANQSSTAFPLLLAMGALNATLSYVGSTSMSLIYVSRANSKSRQGVGARLTCQRADLSWLLLDPMRVSLLAGSTTAPTLRQLGVGQPWTLPWWDCSSSAARQGISRATG